MTIGNHAIRRLAQQAAVTGDELLAGTCAMALAGDREALQLCAERLEADAAADVAAWERDNPDRAPADVTPDEVQRRLRASVRRGC